MQGKKKGIINIIINYLNLNLNTVIKLIVRLHYINYIYAEVITW